LNGMEENINNPIKVLINQKEETVSEGSTISEILKGRGITSRAAVWVNGSQLLLSEYDTYSIRENDQVKILRVVAGG